MLVTVKMVNIGKAMMVTNVTDGDVIGSMRILEYGQPQGPTDGVA